MEIRFTSDITVERIQAVGDDAAIVAAARVSTRGWDSVPQEESLGLLRFLMRHRHATPFEHGSLTVRAHAPAFVWWEWVRHRFLAVDCPDLGFNLESGRYRELEPVFWVPRADRKMVPVAGFKPSRPEFVRLDDDVYVYAVEPAMRAACGSSWANYQELLTLGVAREVARAVLPFSIYYAGWVSGNPRAWLHFLSLRTHRKEASVVSYPQAEIEEAAVQVEGMFQGSWPLTWAAWDENGRVAP